MGYFLTGGPEDGSSESPEPPLDTPLGRPGVGICKINKPGLEILTRISYTQSFLDVSSAANCRCLYFDLSLHLHPYCVYASSEGAGVSVCSCKHA